MSSRVYFILAPSLSIVKIGYSSRAPETRLREILVGMPVDANLLGSVPGGIILERSMHAKFRNFHSRGEWFHYRAPLRRFIAKCLEDGAVPPSVLRHKPMTKAERVITYRKKEGKK